MALAEVQALRAAALRLALEEAAGAGRW
jgi:hypothetical protein